MRWTEGLPEEASLRVGERWRADLRSGAGGGYLWTVQGGADVVSCRVVTGPLPEAGDPPSAVAAPVALEVIGLAPGEAVLQLRLGRPWDPTAVLAEASVAVRVV
jgi:hypothetical protein